MLVQYKRNKQPACYNSNCLVSTDRPEALLSPTGPFKSCGNCHYASHGFVCYSQEGDCLKTDMQKINQGGKDYASNN